MIVDSQGGSQAYEGKKVLVGILKDKNLSPKFGDSLSSFLFEQELLVQF